MAEARNHILFNNVSGSIGGELTIRQRSGKTFISKLRGPSRFPPTEKAIAARERFKSSVNYARYAVNNQKLRRHYESIAKAGQTAYHCAMADAFARNLLSPQSTKFAAPTQHRRMIHNFNAGPSILPKEVFEEAAQAILNFRDTGLSILEIGHRTSLFQSVMDETVLTAKELMKLDGDHEVLFLHGGATTQFFQVPMNLLNENQKAAYLDCGVWGSKAIKEAKIYGNVEVVASSKDKNYTYIPKNYKIPADADYFHYTTNNTIEGTEVFEVPVTDIPLVADMSSDILSHEIDFNRFALIYAGAQKNIGAAGVNMVIVRKDILGKVNRKLPGMMDYQKHIEAGSMLNTPPVFAIYVCLLTLRWLKKMGGVPAIEKINKAKADLLYKTLESKDGFVPTVAKEDRSRMNVVFLIPDPQLEKKFLDACKEQQMIGVKGHRSVGGFRVSLYNALPLESVQALSTLIQQL